MAIPVGRSGSHDLAGRAGRGPIWSRGPGTFGALSGGSLVQCRIALLVRLSELAPGDRLPDAAVIAGALGIADVTVRRALETMCQDGLLDRRRGRAGGTFVARGWHAVAAAFHDADLAVPLRGFHRLLECGLVARSTGEVDITELAALRELVKGMDSLEEHGGLLEYETRFHLQLAETLGEPELCERVADLLGRLCLLQPPPSLVELKARNRQHAKLITALETGDLAGAVSAVKAHRA